jgi:hypothetical protein
MPAPSEPGLFSRAVSNDSPGSPPEPPCLDDSTSPRVKVSPTGNGHGPPLPTSRCNTFSRTTRQLLLSDAVVFVVVLDQIRIIQMHTCDLILRATTLHPVSTYKCRPNKLYNETGRRNITLWPNRQCLEFVNCQLTTSSKIHHWAHSPGSSRLPSHNASVEIPFKPEIEAAERIANLRLPTIKTCGTFNAVSL